LVFSPFRPSFPRFAFIPSAPKPHDAQYDCHSKYKRADWHTSNRLIQDSHVLDSDASVLSPRSILTGDLFLPGLRPVGVIERAQYSASSNERNTRSPLTGESIAMMRRTLNREESCATAAYTSFKKFTR